MIPPLVSFDLAKKHLRLTSNDLDREVDHKLRIASSIATGHCKLTKIPEEWIAEELDDDNPVMIIIDDSETSPPSQFYVSVPGDFQAAILLMLSDLFYNGDASTSEVLSDTVKDLLLPFRYPSMA